MHKRLLEMYNRVRVIIDMRGVDLVDAGFLQELAKLRMYRRRRGLLTGRLVVDSPQLRNALHAVGFDRSWPIFETLEGAMCSFDGPSIFA